MNLYLTAYTYCWNNVMTHMYFYVIEIAVWKLYHGVKQIRLFHTLQESNRQILVAFQLHIAVYQYQSWYISVPIYVVILLLLLYYNFSHF